MGTLLGSLLGAGFLILLGNWWKGRDYMALAFVLAAIGIAAGALLSPAITVASLQSVARSGSDVDHELVASTFMFGICYGGVVAIGLFFIAPSRSAKKG